MKSGRGHKEVFLLLFLKLPVAFIDDRFWKDGGDPPQNRISNVVYKFLGDTKSKD